MFAHKLLYYTLAVVGGILLGGALMFLVSGLLAGSFQPMVLIGLGVGAALIAASFAVSRRPRKSLGLALGSIGGTAVAVGVILVLIALSRREVAIGEVGLSLLGLIGLLAGFWLFSRGRRAAADGEGGMVSTAIGGFLLAVGLALTVWALIQDVGVAIIVVAMAGLIAYLYGLYLSQSDDDRREVADAFRYLEDSAAEGVAREHAAVNRRTFSRWFAELGLLHVVAIIAVIYASFPIVYVISASLNPNGTLTGSNVLFSEASSANFEWLNSTRFWDWFMNSLQVGIITSIATVLMGAAAAYAFSRYRFKGRRGGLISLLIIQMFPQILAFVAIFLLLMTLGFVWEPIGLNSKLALICVYLGGALGANTFLMYGFFNTVPKELDEAAKIDGASHAQIFWTIILRLVAPILAVVGLLSFIGTFNDFVLAKVILQSEGNWTLAVGMYQWVSNLLNQNWGLFAAGAVLGAIPILILFLALQRYIVGGLTAGSVKG